MLQNVYIALWLIPLFTPTILAHSAVDYLDSIKAHNLATLIIGDGIVIEEDGAIDTVRRSDPLGFIGDNYQRIQIHFTMVEKDTENPNSYTLIGKTKVNENVCSFTGNLLVVAAEIGDDDRYPGYKVGRARCSVVLFEDSSQTGSGSIKGWLTAEFIIDGSLQFWYDATELWIDGFCNNQFEGMWTSYRTGKSKTCNWGDYRIPNSGALDIGASEFYVNEEYEKYGWANYETAWHDGSVDNPMSIKAREVEAEKWWASGLPPDGSYVYDVAFDEWGGKSMGITVTVVIRRDSVFVYSNGNLTLTVKGELIESGVLMQHRSGDWIIANKASDVNSEAYGGCQEGPTLIDLIKKKYWLC